MALKKEITLPNGVSADYWRISRYTYCRKSSLAEWTLELFLSAAVRAQSLGISKTCRASIPYQTLKAELTESDMLAIGYTTIKSIIDDNSPNLNPLHSGLKALAGYEDV